jgi:hypothetical protein
MSETEEDRAYYGAVEAAFIRRRGTPFLLSPKDFALVREWRALGVPLPVVERGIDEAFSRRRERGAAGRVNALSYCGDAVLVAWERAAETAVGRGGGREAPMADTGTALAHLSDALSGALGTHPELSEPLESALRSIERLRKGGRPAQDVEASLARLDRKLANDLNDALPAAERAEIATGVARQLAAAKVSMDEATAEKTARALTRRAVREKLSLPRLTLLA